MSSIPGLGRSPRGRKGYPRPYSCLENPHGQRSLAGYRPKGHRVSHDWAHNTGVLRSKPSFSYNVVPLPLPIFLGFSLHHCCLCRFGLVIIDSFSVPDLFTLGFSIPIAAAVPPSNSCSSPPTHPENHHLHPSTSDLSCWFQQKPPFAHGRDPSSRLGSSNL